MSILQQNCFKQQRFVPDSQEGEEASHRTLML